MSRFLFALRLALLSTFLAVPASAHEIDPALADISVDQDRVSIDIELSLESFIMELDLSVISNTTDAPPDEEAAYRALRVQTPEQLRATLDARWPELADGVRLLVDGAAVPLQIIATDIPPIGDPELQRSSGITLGADLPPGDAPVQFGWVARNGDMIVRQVGGGDDAYTAFLQDGALTEPLPRIGERSDSAGSVFLRYIPVGFDHIIPLGIDHILFVLGLFFFALRLRPILLQVSAFTVAHTITLALAATGVVTVPGSVVEPLIAASIVYVGIENIWGRGSERARTALVFGFGLLHGLGFASVLGDFGISASHFAAALIGFNIGVELGQLAVIAVALALVLASCWLARFAARAETEAPVRDLQVMYRAVSIVGSLTISLIGAWWTFERVFL